MDNFWTSLKKPVLALAPLSGITDSAFRRICKGFGADVVYSELASSTAFAYQAQPTLNIVRFNDSERPYVVQLFGHDPEHFAIATRFVTSQIRPDGIDINFGCPMSKVFKRGAGAALMTNPPLAREVIQSVIENTHLPVSIKTRTNVQGFDLLSFLESVGDLDIKAVMIHGRTYAQRFSGPNDFETTREARARFAGTILANGGAQNPQTAFELLEKTGADGVGIARGALGNPWIFGQLKSGLHGGFSERPERSEVLRTALDHARLSIDLKGRRGIIEMRKHLCWYLQQIPGGKKFKQAAVKIESLQDVEAFIDQAWGNGATG
ncbi:MAG: tRNA-dihydrouridine synthase [Syntrophobacteraceae bacterium]|nr:tRNA-dihydrouridine synthase [Syntrophobacteraceae bacterium]